jgi:DNA-binding protein H-NS
MRESQLERMSLKELTTLHTRINQAIAEKRIEERSGVRAKLEEMAKASGFSVAELFGSRGKGGKVAPKYRNPKDPSQTWTGRGRRPKWIVEAGGDLKRFLIAT